MAKIPPLTDFLEKTDRCVKCGLCLPRCPTYQTTQNEAESPRGRIAIMENIAKGTLPLTDKASAHLQNCLTCRSCEDFCPAQVPYGELIESHRAQHPTPHSPWLTPLMSTRWQRAKGNLLLLYQKTGLGWLGQRTGLHRLLGVDELYPLLPPLAWQKRLKSYYPAQGTKKGAVALFIGCISGTVDRPTHHAAIRVLTRCGYAVHVPKAQGCCGALATHCGQAQRAQQQAATNYQAFADLPVSHAITLATGCEQALANAEATLPYPIVDILQFLNGESPLPVRFKPCRARIAIHTPCTARFWQGAEDVCAHLLAQLPGIQYEPILQNLSCCGSGGLNMLETPETAAAVGQQLLASLDGRMPEMLVTTNIGCALHLTHLSKKHGHKLRLCHPIRLLAAHLE